MSRFLNSHDVITDASGERIVLEIDPQHDRVALFDPVTRAEEHRSLRSVRRQLATGEMTSNAAASVSGTLRAISADSPAYQTFLLRQAIVTKIKAMGAQGKSKSHAIKEMIGTNLELASGEKMAMCSARQAYRIMKMSQSDTHDLMPAYDGRGNREPRYAERMKAIIKEHAKNLYAVKKSKITIMKLTDIVNESAHSEGILGKNKNVTRKFVRTVLINELNSDLDHKRLDPRVAKSAKAVAQNRIRPGAPLQRVEIDTLHLPFKAKNEYGIVEDIYVMLAIDCETSQPLSWWLMLAKPTTEDTFSCVERAIYPKASLLKKMGVNFAVDPFGTMLTIVWDNGQENSRARLAAVTAVGISPTWTEVDGGHRKPFVERLNRSLKTALEGLPGCTRCNGKDGARTEEARKDNLMTVGELERWIARWLFEKWVHTQLDRFVTADYEIDTGLGITPAERWTSYEADMTLPLSPPLDAWRKVRYIEIEKSLSHKTGVSHRGFDFKGRNLKNLIAQYGPNAKVLAYYNPHDYRTICVPNKKTGEWIELINAEVTSKTPAYSYDDAIKQRSRIKNSHVEHSNSTKFNTDYANKIIQDGTSKRSREEIKRQALGTVRTADAVKRALKNPLLAQTTEQGGHVDSYISEDAIPRFNTVQKPPRSKRGAT